MAGNSKKYALNASLASLFLIGAASAMAIPVTYYDLDFSSPAHTVGSAPAASSASDTVSRVVFGDPTVESDFSALDGESLVFNTEGNPGSYEYDQVKLNLGYGSDRYQVSFDLSTQNYVGSGTGNHFALLFDTPYVKNYYFKEDGSISGTHGVSTSASFNNDELVSMMFDINLVDNTWDSFMNGLLISSSTYAADDISSLRFSFGKKYYGGLSSSTDSIGIDNILVTNGQSVSPVPVPASLPLLSFAILGFLGCRRVFFGKAH